MDGGLDMYESRKKKGTKVKLHPHVTLCTPASEETKEKKRLHLLMSSLVIYQTAQITICALHLFCSPWASEYESSQWRACTAIQHLHSYTNSSAAVHVMVVLMLVLGCIKLF